jgi:Amt family ammonium transporter
MGGMGGVSLGSQLVGTGIGILIALAGGFMLFGILKATFGLRLTEEQEFDGSDLSLHNISATPERGGW